MSASICERGDFFCCFPGAVHKLLGRVKEAPDSHSIPGERGSLHSGNICPGSQEGARVVAWIVRSCCGWSRSVPLQERGSPSLRGCFTPQLPSPTHSGALGLPPVWQLSWGWLVVGQPGGPHVLLGLCVLQTIPASLATMNFSPPHSLVSASLQARGKDNILYSGCCFCGKFLPPSRPGVNLLDCSFCDFLTLGPGGK